jgi:hypothetical protein
MNDEKEWTLGGHRPLGEEKRKRFGMRTGRLICALVGL